MQSFFEKNSQFLLEPTSKFFEKNFNSFGINSKLFLEKLIFFKTKSNISGKNSKFLFLEEVKIFLKKFKFKYFGKNYIHFGTNSNSFSKKIQILSEKIQVSF